ncbi:MAG: ferrous iron transport protein A [Beutenbergiaceae bacterium]
MNEWRAWHPGLRVVVRYRNDSGSYSDALGEVLVLDDHGLTIATKRGPITVSASSIVLGKPVPPAPVRRRRSR